MALLSLITSTPLGAIGAVTLTGCAAALIAALGSLAYDDLRPKGRHHRA